MEGTAAVDRFVDERFFSLKESGVHTKSAVPESPFIYNTKLKNGRICLKKGKREKLRRLYSYLDA